MRTFDSEALRTASGDVFGRIYEYFLAEFSREKCARQRGVLHPTLYRADNRQRDRARPRNRSRSLPAGRVGCSCNRAISLKDAGEDTMKRGNVLWSRKERDYREAGADQPRRARTRRGLSVRAMKPSPTTRTRTNWPASVTSSWPIPRSTWTKSTPRR